MTEWTYQSGFGNHFASEALPGALPPHQNSPLHPPYGLIAEQLNGSAFTAKRHENRRTWFYRIRPSVVTAGDFKQISRGRLETYPLAGLQCPPTQLRWEALPREDSGGDFIASLVTMAGNGCAASRRGSAIHLYHATQSMTDRYFYNADGDLLIVPQLHALALRTECGNIEVSPGEIVVVPRGLKFQVLLPAGEARGYVLELYGNHFELPGLGPIGANGLANARDFQVPTAAYVDRAEKASLVTKFGGQLWEVPLAHCPLDVVAWHGNYAPYKYDLRHYNTIGSISYDHPDPSIFTVLTAPTEREGCADVDFVIFPARWLVAKDTFRPPYFHRNIMSEYMGLIYGVYDAKREGGFVPGGGSLHNCMSAHGPDRSAYEGALQGSQDPTYLDKTLAFMFESSWVYQPTPYALASKARQRSYPQIWHDIKASFNPNKA